MIEDLPLIIILMHLQIFCAAWLDKSQICDGIHILRYTVWNPMSLSLIIGPGMVAWSGARLPSMWPVAGSNRQHSFVEIGQEMISTAILSLPLIQEGQLSVTGERMCTKYW